MEDYMQNNKQILIFQILSIIFTMILGTLLHFTYEWSNYNSFVASFSSINESTWEHMKLVFFPMFLTILFGYFYMSKVSPNFLCSKVLGIIVSMSFITIFFYTYTGIIGTNFAILDIGSFFVAVLLGEFVAYNKMISDSSCNFLTFFIILIVLLLCFLIFTYYPPQLGYFYDPITGQFGITRRN